MKVWEKPVFSILSVNETKGNSFMKEILGVPKLEGENSKELEYVEVSEYESSMDVECFCPGSCQNHNHNHGGH